MKITISVLILFALGVIALWAIDDSAIQPRKPVIHTHYGPVGGY